MISKEITKLLDTIQDYTYPEYLVAKEHEPRISIGEIVSRAAQYYEKARYSIEYKEEHLLRRTAIERILRRRLTIDFTQEKSGELFLIELIQTGYLPNNELPKRVAIPVQAIINKTVFFISLLEHTYAEKQYSHSRALIIKLATSEIDDLLFPAIVDEATLKAFYRNVKDHITITRSKKSVKEHEVQIYLACRRGLFKEDDATLFYHLWLMYYPEWTELNDANEETDEKLKKIAEEFNSIRILIEEQLKSPLQQRLVTKLKNDIIYFSVIRKIVAKYRETSREIFEDPERLHFVVKDIAEKEYRNIHKRIRKSSWNAVIYIFMTKILLALVVELPFDLIIYKEVQYVALAINVIFHPLLLFAMTTSITEPGSQNTTTISKGVRSVVCGNGHDMIILQMAKARSSWGYVTGILYLAMFLLSFGTIIWVLSRLNFNILGITFFMFFLTFVSYFGLRIRFIARRWIVHTDEHKFTTFLWDLFTLPIISLGRWLVLKFASINIFVFIMDFIIEAPFKIILRAIDTFALFIKEKKDEIY